MKNIRQTKSYSYFIESFWYNNATFSMVLGICSALAVTTTINNALVMGFSVTAVLILSSIIVSSLRTIIPEKVRIITFMLIISTLVIVVDFLLKIYFTDISKSMGPYVGLIITNCILMGRAEAFAIKEKPFFSFFDSLGSGLGYTLSISVIAFVRELLGNGSLMGFKILGSEWVGWSLVTIPAGAFFVLGFYIIGANIIKEKLISKNRN
jgi:Na+-transporting NADH:ubiquinone oxidoreductase subunit D